MEKVQELESELARVKAKLDAVDDADIRGALQLKLESLQAALTAAKAEVEEEESAEETAAPEIAFTAKEIADQLRQARAHLQTGKRGPASDIVNELLKAAPQDVDVLELKADILIAAKDFPAALKFLKKARKLAPTNANVEKKLAHVALQTTVLGSLEDQLRASESGVLIGEGDVKASATVATLLSAIFPGAGHVALGQTKKGVIYAIVWTVFLIVFAVVMQSGKKDAPGAEQGFNLSMPMIGVMFVGLIVYMAALLEIATIGKNAEKRIVTSHPKPPVDLPFE